MPISSTVLAASSLRTLLPSAVLAASDGSTLLSRRTLEMPLLPFLASSWLTQRAVVARARGREGPNVNEAVIVELPPECLEVLGVEVLGQDLLGEGGGGMQDEQTLAPLDDAGILLGLQHIVQTSNKLVEASRGTNMRQSGRRVGCSGRRLSSLHCRCLDRIKA